MKSAQFLIACFTACIAFAEPPRKIPQHLLDRYTMNRTVPVLDLYLNDSYPPTQPIFYSKSTIDAYIERVNKKEVNYYLETDSWLYEALEKYPILGKDVVIIGSVTPWYESIVCAYGGRPTTIDYNKIETDDDRIMVLTVEEFDKNPKKFDVLLSISSIEHDGLGRYGDRINPDGDLAFMAQAKQKFLKEGGHMILAVPVGRDCVVWNAHRIYGRRRLPLLLEKWDIVEIFGFNERELNGNLGNYSYQPVFYLSPK